MNTQFQHKLSLTGGQLDVLAHAADPVPRQALEALPSGGSAAWFTRRVSGQMVAAGLVRPWQEGRRTHYVATDRVLAQACAALLNERPDIPLRWRTDSELRVLLTLPSWRGAPRPWDVAGMAESRWWRTLGRLQDDGFVVRPGRGQWAHRSNPELPALAGFLAVLVRALRAPPDDLGGRAPRCFHQRGAEAAWVGGGLSFEAGYAPVGPSADPAFAVLRDSRAYAFAGTRDLDRWDHALLYAAAHTTATDDGFAQVDRRVALAVAALSTPTVLRDPAFERRQEFYGLEGLGDRLGGLLDDAPEEVEALRRSGAQEGFLAQRG